MPTQDITPLASDVARASPGRPRRPPLGVSLVVLGGLLILVALLGEFTDIGNYPSVPGGGYDRLDTDLVAHSRSLDELYSQVMQRAGQPLAELPPSQATFILFEAVCQRFTHNDRTHHTLFSNWLLWLGGKILRPVFSSLGEVGQPDLLLRHGHSALCGQQSYLLVALAREAGIPARQVGLRNHAVMEAWYDDEWHMYDPDFEAIGGPSPDEVFGVEQLSRKPELLRAIYDDKIDPARLPKTFDRRIISATSDPPWSPSHWKSRLLLSVEAAAEVLEFVIPALMIFVGLMCLRRKARASRASTSGRV